MTMHVAQDLPNRVRVIEHVRIQMPDGIQLAARIWLPENADAAPVPAILEYIPYRRRDSTRARDDVMHGWFAGHGYACARVDIRGSGDSGGVLTDEYLQSELDDGCTVIDWLAKQSWCNGRVGMIGISWGGFNGLQIAALRPAALKDRCCVPGCRTACRRPLPTPSVRDIGSASQCGRRPRSSSGPTG
jgi:putative CocE/NonD family hydrolase